MEIIKNNVNKHLWTLHKLRYILNNLAFLELRFCYSFVVRLPTDLKINVSKSKFSWKSEKHFLIDLIEFNVYLYINETWN